MRKTIPKSAWWAAGKNPAPGSSRLRMEAHFHQAAATQVGPRDQATLLQDEGSRAKGTTNLGRLRDGKAYREAVTATIVNNRTLGFSPALNSQLENLVHFSYSDTLVNAKCVPFHPSRRTHEATTLWSPKGVLHWQNRRTCWNPDPKQ